MGIPPVRRRAFFNQRRARIWPDCFFSASIILVTVSSQRREAPSHVLSFVFSERCALIGDAYVLHTAIDMHLFCVLLLPLILFRAGRIDQMITYAYERLF